MPVRLRTQQVVQNGAGYNALRVDEELRTFDAAKTALVVCDV